MTATIKDTFQEPPVLETEPGKIRKVGFELELAGVNLESIATIVSDLFGGEVTQKSTFVYKVANTQLGDFTIEADSSLLKDKLYKDFLNTVGVQLDAEKQEAVESLMLNAAAAVVPFEIVFPPVAITELGSLALLEKALRDRAALGTRASFLYAFGMQFNPEAPSLNAYTIVAYLRAFFLLLDWLKQEINTDLSRRILPFINDFPEKYVRHVLDLSYTPSYRVLVDDYVSFNPTRNRPLDLLPLFAAIDPDTVLNRVEDSHLVKPRPTFHYRLPDCRIDEPDWSMALEWNRWVKVEELANDPKSIEELSEARLKKTGGLEESVERLLEWMRR